MRTDLLCGRVKIKNLRWTSVRGYVKVFRFPAQKDISDAASDKISFKTRRGKTDDD